MNRRIDFNQLGGFPISQNTLAFLQQSYRDAFAALAAYFGDFVILSGVTDLGANYSDGWVCINGELVPFIGGTKASNIVITETVVGKLFADGSTKNVWYTRSASCASSGGTPFTSFTRLSGAKNDQLNLTAEVNARTSGDSNLQSQITALQTQVGLKANSAQPAWVNLTLINGWTAPSGQTPQYRINSFNKVEFRGRVQQGTTNVFCSTVPAIPNVAKFPIIDFINDTYATVRVNGTNMEYWGGFNIAGGYNLDLSPIAYYLN